MLHLVEPLPNRNEPASTFPFAGVVMPVAFAATDRAETIAEGARVRLAHAPAVSADDAYLVLPLRARMELSTAFARGALGRIRTWLSEARVVRAELDAQPSPRLWVGAAWSLEDVLRSTPAHTLSPGPDAVDTVRAMNHLPTVHELFPTGLFDLAGYEAMTAFDEMAGAARQGSGFVHDLETSAFVWASRDAAGLTVRLALSLEDDEAPMAALVPVRLRYSDAT